MRRKLLAAGLGHGIFKGGCRVWALVAVVVLAAAPAFGQAQDLLLESELASKQVLVQSQAIYRLRFYHAVDVRDLRMTGPTARLADVRLMGPERVYESQRNGRRYRVHERSYAVVPLGSGPLTLSGAHVLGRVAAVSASSADRRQTLRLDAPDQTLQVQPVPMAAASVAWLPARTLVLTENWLTSATQMRLGQTLQRSIRIEASGVDAGQIPPLSMVVPGMQVESEAPQLTNRTVGDFNLGVREQNFLLVPLKAGEVWLPELQLPWWDLQKGTLTAARLPARRLHIEAQAGAVPAPLPSQAPARQVPFGIAPKAAGLMAAAVVLCAVLLYCVRRPKVRAAWHLQRACGEGRAQVVRDALLAWAALVWQQSPPLTLLALAERCPEPAVRHALGVIERSLYGLPSDLPSAASLKAALHTVQRRLVPELWKANSRPD